MSKNKTAFLGTGLMGAPMVRNLLAAGQEVSVWNRTVSKAEPLAEFGAHVCSTPHQAVENADFVFTMVTDGTAVEALLFSDDLIRSISSGATVIDMSSIKPKEAKEHSERLKQSGINHLDAPVSGGTRGAEAATLAIMAGGEETIFEKAKPLLNILGNPVRVGPSGAGQLSKLANQAIVGVTIGVVAEAMLLAEQGDANPAAIREALKGGFADSVILQQHGERMTTGNFEPGGLCEIQLKDLKNALEEAANNGLELPLTEQMRARYDHFCNALDGGQKDHSAIYLELKNRNKL